MVRLDALFRTWLARGKRPFVRSSHRDSMVEKACHKSVRRAQKALRRGHALPWKLVAGWCFSAALSAGLFTQSTTRAERLLAAATLGMTTLLVFRGKGVDPRTSAPTDDLDVPLVAFDRENALTLRGLLANLIVFGRTGSGKTSGSGFTLLRGILRHPRSGGILLSNKPSDRADFKRLAQQTGRTDDVLWFSLQDTLRFNVLDHVYRVSGGSTAEIVSCLMTVGETLRSGGQSGHRSDDAAYWRKLSEQLLYHAVQIVKLARQGITAADLQRFLGGAAHSPEELRQDAWREGFHSELLQAALNAPKSLPDQIDCEAAVEFFLGQLPDMADRTRSSIEVGVNSILFVFNTGLARELISTTTNFDIGQLAHGKWLFVDTNPSVLGDAGLLVGACLKYVVQRDILRRDAGPESGFTVVWVDEYAQWATSFDARTFLPMCRQYRGCLVALTQSVHGLRATLGGSSEHESNALLANFHHRVFHALGSADDAEFASDLVGKRHRMLLGGSVAPAESLGDELFGGRGRITSNFSTQLEAVVQPRAFLNGLRCGGPANDFCTDVIIVRTGEPFANGENVLRATFRQI